jgi:hypothetical protein
MSDFFDSLVARARGLQPELVPRVPSLFEAPAVGGPPEGDPVESVVDANVRRRDEPPYAVPPDPEQLQVPPTPESGAAVLPATPRTADRVNELERHVVRETATARDLDSPRRSREPLSPTLEHESGAAVLPATPRTADRVSAVERQVVRETVTARDLDSPRRSREPLSPTLEHEPAPVSVQPSVDAEYVRSPAPTRRHESGLVQAASVDAPSVTVETTAQTSVRSEPTSSELRPGTPQRVPAVVSARRLDPPTTAPTGTESTIHVTIGRVEIRAIPEVAPAQAPRTARPRTQSLDEYLAERNQRRQA